ncbi:DUF7551 domain-containing protein [Halorussus amylolyticus]|uniref:DUF7551 domain-containing protein n=1 Tax=Halorussus amylolyticus TaxID=1126242 RepID=UPI00138F3EB4|nr:hypothetical protein [Halorussus amylolyticus]
MVGGTLRELRQRIVEYSTETGRYFVSCARTGERPVPVAGQRFPDREGAAEAARAAAAYRAELRQYDPQLPCYDLVVSEDPGRGGGGGGGGGGAAPGRGGGAAPPPHRPVHDPGVPAPPGRAASSSESEDDAAIDRGDAETTGDGGTIADGRTTGDTGTTLDFCHDVAAATFESLSELGHRDAERGTMDAYLHSAEAIPDPDDLCLVLLSTMATELDARLSPDQQAEVLEGAADRLGIRERANDPVTATLARFDGLSLVGDYAVTPRSESGASRSWRVTLDGYAFDRSGGRLPTLPLAVELLRHLPDRTLAVTDVRTVGDRSWQCVVTAGADRAAGVANAVPTTD